MATRRAILQCDVEPEADELADLVGPVAHDLNNLLVTILGNADLARRESGLPEKARERLERVREAGATASALTRRLLDLGRERAEVEPAACAERLEGRGTVLVVDDEPDVREVAEAMLLRLGFDVELAVDAQQAHTLFAARAREIVAVLLDASLPEIGGRAALDALRAIRPDAPVVLMSGYTERDASARLPGRGVFGFLQKPFGPDELARALNLPPRA